MKEVDLSAPPKQQKTGNGGGIGFLRFESNKTYKLRPFGNTVEFYKLFIEKGKKSIIVDPDVKDEAARLLSEATGREIKPKYCNAMFAINRIDGSICILEGGWQIYEQLANWSANSGVRPGAPQAGDWTITVTGDGVGGSNPRKYLCTYMGPVPFSENEKVLINKLKSENKLKLANYLKETPLDQVLEQAGFGTPSNANASVGADADMNW